MPTGLRRPGQSPSPWQAAHREVSGLDISCIIVQYPSSSRCIYIFYELAACVEMCGMQMYAVYTSYIVLKHLTGA